MNRFLFLSPAIRRLIASLVFTSLVVLGMVLAPLVALAGDDAAKQDPVWNAPLENVPGWLEMYDSPNQLYSEYQFPSLAGRLITFGKVDASSCFNGGLLESGSATDCGVLRAQAEVYRWQNQFNAAIINSSQNSGVPPRLLKNIFAWESQFWPQATYVNTYEYGLGHITLMGADSVLRWNASFYASTCASSFSPETCTEDYAEQPAPIRSALMGVVVQKANADCPECTYYLDLPKAERSIPLFANTVLANAAFVRQYIRNQTGKPAISMISYEDLWKFSLTSYNAGPGCFVKAFSTIYYYGLPYDWKNFSRQLQPACRGAVPYVEFISNTDAYFPSHDPSLAVTPTATATGLPTVTPTLSPTMMVTLTVTTTVSTPTPPIDPVLSLTITPPAETVVPTDTLTSTLGTITSTVAVTPTGILTATVTDTPAYTVTATAEITITAPIQPFEAPHLRNEIILKIDAQNEKSSIEALQTLGIDLEQDSRAIAGLDALVLRVAPQELSNTLQALNQTSGVIFAEPNYLVAVSSLPNDPGFSRQGNLGAIQVPRAWDALAPGQDVLVAVVDTGVDLTHPDLVDGIWQNPGETGTDDNGNDKRTNGIDDDGNGYIDDWRGWNIVAGNNEVQDDQGHGTNVAGVIGAGVNNSIGIAGIAPNARLLIVKALNGNGYGTYAQAAEGIIYATDMGARIINLGFGGEGSSELLRGAVNYALEHGVLVVAAGGNTGKASVLYPAAYPGVVSVSAVDNTGTQAAFSSSGDHISLAAPGVDIPTTALKGLYTSVSGTSLSAAHVSGVAALLAGQPQFTSADGLDSALRAGALDLGEPGRDPYFGYGMVQALAAWQYSGPVLPIPPPAVVITSTLEAPGAVFILADAPTANITNYANAVALNCSTGTVYTPLNGATPVTALQADEAVTGPFSLGFDFWYMGTRYTQVWVSSNGWMSFTDPAGSANPTNNLTSGAPRPLLAPLWDDLSGTGGTASYLATGTAPNRTFTFEWLNWRWDRNATGAVISFQVQLSESTGRVQYYYRQQGTAVANGSGGASIGFNAFSTGSGRFISMSNVACPPTWSSTVETNNLNTRPAINSRWRFTPPSPTAPTALAFTNVVWNSMTLNWTDNSGAVENGFVIYQSTDNVNFTFLAQTAANATSYIASSLASGTTYYWRVYAVSEGGLSTVLAGTQATAPNTAPTVTITTPANNASFVQGTQVTFTGTATDVQDGNLSANISWSSNLSGSLGKGASLSTSSLGLGVHTITAHSTDSGGLTGTATITVLITDASGNTPPSVTITSPANNASFVQGTVITFTGSASDLQDGNLSANLSWSSSINGVIGTGATFTTSTLSLGIHTITAQVADAGGMVGLNSILIMVTNAAGYTPPAVKIISPVNGSSFEQDERVITFVGSALVPVDGNISSNILWSSSLDGILCNPSVAPFPDCSSFSRMNLSVGVHTITAQATGFGELVGVASVTITVTAPTAPHGSFNGSTESCSLCHRSHSSVGATALTNNCDSPLVSNNFCLSCHRDPASTLPACNTNNAPVSDKVVSTHSNVDQQNVINHSEANFELLCIQCHNPHGGERNLVDTRTTIRLNNNEPYLTTGPVTFTATTGTGSYDDGVSATSSRICVTCHENPSNPGYPMVNHSGGANHGGGANYVGQDCTSCHPHSIDSSANTRDGFMTGCRACHSKPQGTRRQIVGATGGDFTRASHHVNGPDTITDADCQVCHDTTNHKSGSIWLYNVDTGISVNINDAVNGAANYEKACSSCHDANGRNGDTTPFSDGQLVPEINSGLWAAAKHNIAKLTFNGSCRDCHDSGHGSNKFKLLAPWNAVAGTAPDVMQQEQKFCFICHATGSLTGTPVQAAFGYANTATGIYKHNVDPDNGLEHTKEVLPAQFANRHSECGDCHEPHAATTGLSTAPVNRAGMTASGGAVPVWNASGAPASFNFLTLAANEYQVCMKCHSSYTTLPTYLPDGWNTSTGLVANGLKKLTSTNAAQVLDSRDMAREFNPNNASFHPLAALGKNTLAPAAGFVTGWSVNSRVYCTDCHTNGTPDVGGNGPHGSPLLHILDGSLTGDTNYSTVSGTSRNGDTQVPSTQICFKCHNYSTYVTGGTAAGTRFRDGGSTGRNLHVEHMNGSLTRTTCYTCHDTHGSEQQRLINFDVSVAAPTGGRTSQTAWTASANTASCYVACHGFSHNPVNYTP